MSLSWLWVDNMQFVKDGAETASSTAQTTSSQADLATLEKTQPAKTTGEKAFGAIRFMTGEVLILGLTAGIAYAARHGPDKVGPIPNVFKKIDEGMKRLLIEKPNPQGRMLRLAGAAVATTTLMWGGNLYVPVRKGLQDNKEAIVTGINQRYGKPGEAEAGAIRLEHETKESWGDIIKGRLGSWAVVFGSFVGIDLALGKSAKNGQYHLDNFEDKFGKLMAGVTEKGKALGKSAVAHEITELHQNKAYRFGKIMALDIYATAASLVVWDVISRISAKKRHQQDPRHTQPVETHAEHIKDAAADPMDFPVTARALTDASALHAARLGERPADYRALALQSAENAAAATR